jgi:LacI family transcriptional regulator
MARKRTIEDIARLAKVSKATVSRVINHKPDVDPETRQRVLRIMEEEGFIPNITASGLAGGRKRLIGVLVPSFTVTFIPSIIHGVAEVVGSTLYELVLYSISDKVRQNNKGDIIDYILSTNVIAGLLAILPGQSSKYVIRLHQHGFPTVIIDDEANPPAAPWVGANNKGGAYKAVKHLIDLGHTRIAHIKGLAESYCTQERHKGYSQAMEEAGLSIDPDLIVTGDFELESGLTLGRYLIGLPAEKRPTAIFSSGDVMAYGVIAAAKEYGLSIPGDIALVGFDDLPSSTYVYPPLTTVKQPFTEMGKQGITMLLNMLERQHEEQQKRIYQPFGTLRTIREDFINKPEHIQLETSLIIRGSCGAQTTEKVLQQPPKLQ